ncbi:hypothetical protein TrRE_jg9920 [Triparma retinervis]|uniref:Uncharacterized protein n=1 Tax=Triparma retinervis TaxID=2557542 RepID=A0A9W7DRB9_9STRA|nr:hypothetical protein TrRE_jg9920 [Triparma retinervis]
MGRTITSATTQQQCAFFNAAYCSSLAGEDGTVPTKLPESRFEDNLVPPVLPAPTADLDDSSDTPSAPVQDMDPNFLSFFRSLVLSPSVGGTKRLKKHRSTSPLIVIISSSAKRSCQILQLLAPLKARIAKLFSKNMSVPSQVSMLSSPHPCAVGTPNRLLKLAEDGALSFGDTGLVIFDMKADKKGFSVVTLRDCQRDLMALVRDHVVERRECKLVMY